MRNYCLITVSCLLLAAPLHAYDYTSIEFHLFEPELVMHTQEKIGLSDSQRETIKSEVQKAQSEYVGYEWEIEAMSGKLETLVKNTSVDEAAAIGIAEDILDLENKVKKVQLALLIRIKNVLTEEQQDILFKIRKAKHGGWENG